MTRLAWGDQAIAFTIILDIRSRATGGGEIIAQGCAIKDRVTGEEALSNVYRGATPVMNAAFRSRDRQSLAPRRTGAPLTGFSANEAARAFSRASR